VLLCELVRRGETVAASTDDDDVVPRSEGLVMQIFADAVNARHVTS